MFLSVVLACARSKATTKMTQATGRVCLGGIPSMRALKPLDSAGMIVWSIFSYCILMPTPSVTVFPLVFRTLCENDPNCCHWVFRGSTNNGKPKVCWLKREKGTLVNKEEHKRKKVFSGSINCPGSSYEPKNCSKPTTVTSGEETTTIIGDGSSFGKDTTPKAGNGDSRSTTEGDGRRTSTTDGNGKRTSTTDRDGSSSGEFTTTTVRKGGKRTTTDRNEGRTSTTEGNEGRTSTAEENGSSSREFTTITTGSGSTSGLFNRALFFLLSIIDFFAIDS